MRPKTDEAPDDALFEYTLLGRPWRAFGAWVRRTDPLRRRGRTPSWLPAARIAYLSIRDFVVDRCTQQAAALTYTTVLSLVPLLAFAFSLAKGLGAYDALRHRTIQSFLDSAFPVNDGGQGMHEVRAAIERVLDFVDHTDATALGTFGAVFLFWTVISLLGSVERTFNEVWSVQRSRSWVRKVTDYLAIVVITPIFFLTITAASATAAAFTKPASGAPESSGALAVWLRDTLGAHSALLLSAAQIATLWLLLSFVYKTMPNTRVRWTSALIGGLFAGALWHGAQILHVQFQIGVARYNALYASFAALPLFLVWLYASWVIVLAGAELAAAHQFEPQFHPAQPGRHGDPAFRELVALRALSRITRAFLRGAPPPSAAKVAEELALAEPTVDAVLRELELHQLISAAGTDEDRVFLPARDPSLITIKTVADALRGDPTRADVEVVEHGDVVVDRLLARLDDELRASAHNKNLREIVLEAELERADLAQDARERSSTGPRTN